MSDGTPDNPGVIAPPPLIYAGPLALGLLLKVLFPVRFLPPTVGRILGGSLIAVGILVGSIGFRELRGAGTNVDVSQPVTTLVVEGPYGFTRNPLYISLTLTYTGIALLANALWALLLLPAVLLVMRRGVIDREERYLEKKFGAQYLRYKAQVRRWL